MSSGCRSKQLKETSATGCQLVHWICPFTVGQEMDFSLEGIGRGVSAELKTVFKWRRCRRTEWIENSFKTPREETPLRSSWCHKRRTVAQNVGFLLSWQWELQRHCSSWCHKSGRVGQNLDFFSSNSGGKLRDRRDNSNASDGDMFCGEPSRKRPHKIGCQEF